MNELPLIATTMGDPAGIGPEVLAKAAAVSDVRREVIPWVFGDPSVLEAVIRACRLELSVVECSDAAAARSAGVGTVPVLPLSRIPWRPGEPSPESDRAQLDFVEEAVRRLKTAEVGAMTTAPVHKLALHRAGCPFAGHTDLLGARFDVAQPVMMLAGPSLRVVPLTVHVPIREVPSLVTPERLETTIRVVHESFRRDFALDRPRIAVAGLNPHAGEAGMFGDEDRNVIEPVIQRLASEGLDAQGPFSADSIFKRAADGEFDVVLGMYHDQALIPLKLLDFDRAVNVTLGLPVIRTSVDHGTAYDIAGEGVASAGSMIEALRLSGRMVRARRRAARP